MKKKVMVRSLPKAQVGLQQPPIGLTDEQKATWLKIQSTIGNGPAFNSSVDAYQGNSNSNITGQPIGSGTPLEMATGFKQSNQQKSWNYFKPDQLPKVSKDKKYNPYIAPALLSGTDLFRSITKKIEGADARNNFKNQFLSDRLYTAKEDDATDNRGDYLTNTPGFGLDFRPNQAIYGDYNKIAQMGGEMKRKVRITNLPQAGYGGTQDAKAVNQLYGNSAYMMNMYNGATEGVPQEEYNKTLTPDPRSVSVLEAEKGETLVRKGTNSTIPELFTIGGKRHSEGGTPLGPEKATPDSFIFSDTKAMKIKDEDTLKSFGFTAKKGGYTPAAISKKFDLNSKELREGLYSETDPLRKSTAILMADNYISNLGKLALVQEAKKGFPQGAPEIAKPYMEKVGLDPTQFLPPSPQEGMAMAMYGGIPKAQIGRSVGSNDDITVDNLPKYEYDYMKFRQRANDPNIPQPSTQEYMAAQKAYNAAKFNNSSMANPNNWGSAINYGLTGQFENMGDSYAKWNGKDYWNSKPYMGDEMGQILRYGTEPAFMATIAAPIGQGLRAAATRLGMASPNIANATKMGLAEISSSPGALLSDVLTIPYIEQLAGPAALGTLIAFLNRNDQSLSYEQQTELLKKLDTDQVDELMQSPVGAKVSSDSLMEASKSNPDIDFNKIQDTIIKVKPSVKTKTKLDSIRQGMSIDDLLNEKVNTMVDKKAYGGELDTYQAGGEKEFEEEVFGPGGVKLKRITKGNIVTIVDADGKVLGSKTIENNYRTINPDRLAELEKRGIKLNVPKRYEGKEWSMTPGRQGIREGAGSYGTEEWYAGENKDDFAKRQARFLRFYPKFNPKNENDNAVFQNWYNSDIYDQSIKSGLSEEESKKNVNEFGFDPESKDPNRLDSKFGHYTWSRPTFNIERKPKTIEKDRDQIETNELNTNAAKKRPIGFYPQDTLNSSAAFADLTNINRYYPKMTQFNPQSMKPTYYDPNRELANNAEMANIAAQNMSQFTGPQAFNARFAETQGRGLANAANVLGRYNNLNVGVANQFEQANSQLRNEANLKNAMLSNDFYDKTNITNQQYDNSMRAARRQLVDYNNAALTNRFMTDQMNSLYPNFYVNPTSLQTYYTPGQQITPKQKGNDMMAYLNSTGIPFDFTNPNVQTALLKGMMGDVNTDERGNIVAASAAANNRRRSK